MLAAWDRKDHLCIPAHCLCQRIISRHITGMQRDNHIHLIDALIICDIPHQKRQLLIGRISLPVPRSA